MLRDLADAWGWIGRIIRRIERLESGSWLENSSITNGRLRLIGGLLRLDSGALLELIGQWRFFGNGAITGDVVAEGKWTQNGPWEYNGDGDIYGDVDLVGILKSGNVRIEDGKIYVGAGGTQIVIDGVTGKLTAGNLTIDPANGGVVSFPGGAVVKAGSGGGIAVQQGSYAAVVTSSGASVGRSGNSISVTDSGFRMDGLPTGSPGNGTPAGNVYVDGTGYLRRSSGS